MCRPHVVWCLPVCTHLLLAAPWRPALLIPHADLCCTPCLAACPAADSSRYVKMAIVDSKCTPTIAVDDPKL